MPLALLKAVEAEGLLIPTRVAGQERYTTEDVAASRAGLLLLEWGIPLSDLLDLARRHHQATEAVAARGGRTVRPPRPRAPPPRSPARRTGPPRRRDCRAAPGTRPSTDCSRPTPSCCRR